MKGRALTFLAVCAAALALPSAAWALLSTQVTLTGGQLGAATVNKGNTPTATVSGRDVTLSWTASTLSGGRAVTAYAISRTNTSPGSLSTTVAGTCASTPSSPPCTDKGLPENGTSATTWKYKVTPKFDLWTGTASTAGTLVTVPGPTLALTTTSFTTSGGTTTSTVANYFDTEVAHFCLGTSAAADTTTCTGAGLHTLGTKSVGASGGTTTKSLTIPALPAGSYTLYAKGSAGSDPAGVAITVAAPKPALVQSATSTTTTVTLPGNVTAGDALILVGDITSGANHTISAVTGGGVTWHVAQRQTTSAVADAEIWYGMGSSGGAAAKSVTVTLNSTKASVIMLDLSEWSHVSTFHSTVVAKTKSASKNKSITTGTVTPTTSNELLVAAAAIETTGSSVSPGAPFVKLANNGPVAPSGTGVWGFAAYYVDPATAKIAGTWTEPTTSKKWGAAIAAFS